MVFCKQNSGDLDQRPHPVASDLGLHCLPMSHKKEARLIWVKPMHKNMMAILCLHCLLTCSGR